MKLQAISGKQFVHPGTKESYGLFRLPRKPSTFSTLDGRTYPILAEDESGNYITEMKEGSIWFWDHETDDMEKLAETVVAFIQGCTDPEPVNLQPSQVKSAWIDPDLASSLDAKVPEDGWVKKKS